MLLFPKLDVRNEESLDYLFWRDKVNGISSEEGWSITQKNQDTIRAEVSKNKDDVQQ